MASWLLARVCAITRGRMPYSYDHVQGSDGNDLYIGFTCHSDDGILIGSVIFLASADHIMRRLFRRSVLRACETP